MTRLFDDEQSSSLITSMMNPESNASKFIEQGEDIGLPRDVTMDILNKYATYGANTGIGNLGGERLVNALNEEYRKRVDAPLQSDSQEMFLGGIPVLSSIAEFIAGLGTGAVDAITSVFKAAPEVGGAAIKTAEKLPELGIPIDVEGASGQMLNPIREAAASAPEAVEELSKLEKFIEANPVAARTILSGSEDLAALLGRQLGSRGDKGPRTGVRSRTFRGQPRQIKSTRIGMAAGGKPEEGSVLGRKLFIQGGEVDGPGGPKEDLVPIWASDSEYVVSEKGVRNMGGGDFEKGIAALDKINFGKRNV